MSKKRPSLRSAQILFLPCFETAFEDRCASLLNCKGASLSSAPSPLAVQSITSDPCHLIRDVHFTLHLLPTHLLVQQTPALASAISFRRSQSSVIQSQPVAYIRRMHAMCQTAAHPLIRRSSLSDLRPQLRPPSDSGPSRQHSPSGLMPRAAGLSRKTRSLSRNPPQVCTTELILIRLATPPAGPPEVTCRGAREAAHRLRWWKFLSSVRDRSSF